MFGFIKKMFGEGKIRADIVLVDGTKGTVKVSYKGDLSNIDHDEFARYVKNTAFVESGKVVKSVKIVGIC